MARGSPESAERRSGAPLIVTALLLAGAGAILFWLDFTGRLQPLIAGTPAIVVELPSAVPSENEPAAAEPSPVAAAEPTAPPSQPGPEEESAEPPEPVLAPPPPAATTTPDDPAPAAEPAPGSPPVPQPSQPAGETPAETAPPPAAPEPPQTAQPMPAAESDPAAAVPAAEPAPLAEAAAATSAGSGADAPAAAPASDAAQVTLAWQRLARPFPADESRPRIAVVVAGLGLSEAATTAAIQQLPAEVTLSFSPYSDRLDEFVAMARAAGHEVLLDLPMEPASFPRDDPGPRALLTSLDQDANAERLAWALGRADGYLGVATYMGSRFTTSPEDLRPVLEELRRRELLLLDSRAATDSVAAKLAAEEGVAHAINDRFIDNEASRVAIDGRLQQIERIARTSGAAVAMGYAYPVTIERLTEWARGLSGEGLALAPISAVADRQELR